MVLDLQTKDAEAALYGKRIGVLANTGAVSNKMITQQDSGLRMSARK